MMLKNRSLTVAARTIIFAVVLSGRISSPIAAQEPSQPPAVAERPDASTQNAKDMQAAPAAATEAASEAASETEAERRQKTRVVEAASLLLLVLVAASVFLIAAVVVWGARARRLVRAPLPSQSAPDRLWYLRKKPRTSRDTAPDAAPEDEATK